MAEWVHSSETGKGTMTVRPLTPDRFADLEAVFGDRGVARRCFCMHWRRPDGGFGDERDNRDRFRDVVDDERAPGLVGYVDAIPLGWVQVGPRHRFPTLGRSRIFKPVDDGDPWSINCFVVKPGNRRQGIAAGLLAAAVAFAEGHGARVIEAYPVDGSRSTVVDYYTGTMGMFTEIGFVEVARRKVTRPLVQLEVK